MPTPTTPPKAAKPEIATTLDAGVFGITPANHMLLKEAYVAYLANGRRNLAVTKNRGAVSGGGRKPWRQKGTGRARVGSSRVPNWRGGGVSFGPTGSENYSKHLNVKAMRLALRQALSLAAAEGRVKVIGSLESKDGKTRKMITLLEKAGATGRTLIALKQKDDMLGRATRNLANVEVVNARHLNVFDVMNADTVVLPRDAYEEVVSWLSTGAKKAPAPAKKMGDKR